MKVFKAVFKTINILFLISISFVSSSISKEDLRSNLDTIENNIELSNLQFDPYGGLEHYIQFTVLNNPEIRSAYYQLKASYEKTGYAGALPDPMISVGYFIESVETRVGPQNKKLGLKQTIPWFGSLGNKKNIAYASAKASFQKYNAVKFRVIYQLKKGYYDYYLIGKEVDLTNENIELLKFWESVTRTKYKLALSKHPDLIKVQLELGQLEDNLLTLKERKSSAETRIRTLINLPDTIDIPLPETIHIDEISILKDTVTQQVLDNNPELLSLINIIEKEKQTVSLASKQSYPNFTFGVDYIETGEALNPTMQDSGKDPWMFSVGLNVPLWFGKNKAKKSEAKARLNSADQNRLNKKNELVYFVDHLVVEYDDNLRKVQLYRDGLIPKAKQLLNATYTSYQADKTDFLNLLDAQRQLLKLQLQLDRANTRLATVKAQIDMLSGKI